MSEQLRHLANNIRRQNGDLSEAAICEREADNIDILRKTLETAAGRLTWCANAKPGVAHPDGGRMVEGWAEDIRVVLASTTSE